MPDALTLNTYSLVSLHKAPDCCLHDWISLIKSLSFIFLLILKTIPNHVHTAAYMKFNCSALNNYTSVKRLDQIPFDNFLSGL